MKVYGLPKGQGRWNDMAQAERWNSMLAVKFKFFDANTIQDDTNIHFFSENKKDSRTKDFPFE